MLPGLSLEKFAKLTYLIYNAEIGKAQRSTKKKQTFRASRWDLPGPGQRHGAVLTGASGFAPRRGKLLALDKLSLARNASKEIRKWPMNQNGPPR
jgi:hypothetical protein